MRKSTLVNDNNKYTLSFSILAVKLLYGILASWKVYRLKLFISTNVKHISGYKSSSRGTSTIFRNNYLHISAYIKFVSRKAMYIYILSQCKDQNSTSDSWHNENVWGATLHHDFPVVIRQLKLYSNQNGIEMDRYCAIYSYIIINGIVYVCKYIYKYGNRFIFNVALLNTKTNI